MSAGDPVAGVLVDAALAPVGPERTATAVGALVRTAPDALGFAGWRALLLLDDALAAATDPAWRVRTAGLRRRSFVAAAVAGRWATQMCAAFADAGIDHVVTGELALALRYPRPGDRPVHGVTLVTAAPHRRAAAVVRSLGLRPERSGPRSLVATADGLRLLVHRGWPGAPTEPLAPDPTGPADGAFPVATPAAEARRIGRPPADPDPPAERLDLAACTGGIPVPPTA
ncbi:MAG: hypothetical protein FJW77_06880 [Actinobacteria bacterium]|nr:hypothetical protein [Actinomycetota bacterium]